MNGDRIVVENAIVILSIEKAEAQLEHLKRMIKAPCMSCKYEGVFRCEACAEDYYRGYNVKDYPNNDNSFAERVCNTCLDHKEVFLLEDNKFVKHPCPDCNGPRW